MRVTDDVHLRARSARCLRSCDDTRPVLSVYQRKSLMFVAINPGPRSVSTISPRLRSIREDDSRHPPHHPPHHPSCSHRWRWRRSAWRDLTCLWSEGVGAQKAAENRPVESAFSYAAAPFSKQLNHTAMVALHFSGRAAGRSLRYDRHRRSRPRH